MVAAKEGGDREGRIKHWIELDVWRVTPQGHIDINTSKMLFNTHHIVSVAPDKGSSCKLVTSTGVEYYVANSYDFMYNMIGV